MAELMMLNKDYSAGKSSLTRESQVLPLGKDYGKTKAGEKDSASLDFSNFLRASKEEGEKREEVRTDKEEKKPAVEDKKDEKTGKTKKTEAKKENGKEKVETKADGTREEKIATVLTENSFLIERDQLKAELQTHPDLALTVAKVEDGAALKQSGEPVDATAVLQNKEAGKTAGQKLNLSVPSGIQEEGEGKEGVEALLKPVAEGNAKEKVADALPKEEKVELHEKKTKEEKTSKVLEDRIARPDLKKEDTPIQQGLQKVEPHFKEEGTKSVFKEEQPMKLVTKEESIPKDVATFLNEKMDLHKGEIKIELEPRSLGQITVKVNFIGGKANVVILAENPKTLHLLQNGAGEMARILEEKTGEITKVIVHEENQGEQFFRDNDSNSKENKNEAERRLREAEEEKNKGNTEEFLHRMRLGLTE